MLVPLAIYHAFSSPSPVGNGEGSESSGGKFRHFLNKKGVFCQARKNNVSFLSIFQTKFIFITEYIYLVEFSAKEEGERMLSPTFGRASLPSWCGVKLGQTLFTECDGGQGKKEMTDGYTPPLLWFGFQKSNWGHTEQVFPKEKSFQGYDISALKSIQIIRDILRSFLKKKHYSISFFSRKLEKPNVPCKKKSKQPPPHSSSQVIRYKPFPPPPSYCVFALPPSPPPVVVVANFLSQEGKKRVGGEAQQWQKRRLFFSVLLTCSLSCPTGFRF